jgi:hypothetical protein
MGSIFGIIGLKKGTSIVKMKNIIAMYMCAIGLRKGAGRNAWHPGFPE